MEEPRTYEFACHITTKLDESKVPALWGEVQAIIQKHGAEVLSAQAPAPKRLSYEIRKEKQSLFAWIQFSTDNSDLLSELDEWARLHPEILRHIVLKLEHESDARAKKQAEHLERRASRQAQEVSKQSVDRQKIAVEKKSEDSGKLEEQLEDILGNI